MTINGTPDQRRFPKLCSIRILTAHLRVPVREIIPDFVFSVMFFGHTRLLDERKRQEIQMDDLYKHPTVNGGTKTPKGCCKGASQANIIIEKEPESVSDKKSEKTGQGGCCCSAN